MADKEIFMTNDKSQGDGGMSRSLFSDSSPITQSTTCQSSARDGNSASGNQAADLTTEEEVFLMNIDYFEQWDRVHQKHEVQEKEVLQSMKINGVRMI